MYFCFLLCDHFNIYRYGFWRQYDSDPEEKGSEIAILKKIRFMKQVTLNVDDSKFKAFLEFIKTLDYVKVEDVEEMALEELQSSLKQVKLMQEGRLPKQSAKDFLNEL